MRKTLIRAACAAAAVFGMALAVPSGPAHADGCGDSSWGGSCDHNYAPDGSHEHCDYGWAPFVGNFHNCFWVNTHP